MTHRFDSRETLRRRIFEQSRDQVDGFMGGPSENLMEYQCFGSRIASKEGSHLIEGVRLDLRKLVFHVVGIHGANLFPRRSAQNFDDLHELVNPRLSWEEWLP